MQARAFELTQFPPTCNVSYIANALARYYTLKVGLHVRLALPIVCCYSVSEICAMISVAQVALLQVPFNLVKLNLLSLIDNDCGSSGVAVAAAAAAASVVEVVVE